MATEFGEVLQTALSKADNTSNYLWKGPKVNGIQKEVKLIDCSEEELKHFLDHCNQMLYNKNEKNPGRLVLLDIVNDQIMRCRAELLIRWLRSEKNFTYTQCFEAVRTIINKNRAEIPNIEQYSIGQVMDGIPTEYTRIPITLVQSACLDGLGLFNNSHLTLNFILRLGIWLTQKEMQTPYPDGLYIKDPVTGKAQNRLELIKKELHLNPNINLKIVDTGLSYAEFRSMCRLRRDKYANLTSDQLRLLSNKVLYRFQEQCELQAKQWMDKKAEILEVAKVKNYNIVDPEEQVK